MSSPMRISGLASGMDIDEIVEKLMQAERAPLDKLEQQKQTYEWTRDAYRNVNTKLQTFDTYIADNLILKNFNTKTATTSNSSLVEATATGSAAGTLTIEGVSQLATAARAVGSQVNATGTTKLGDLFANSGVTVNQNYIEIRAIQKDGTLASTATKIEFNENMTVNEFVSKINSSNAGVSAIFENGRLSITAKNTGDVKGGAEIVVDSGQEVFAAFGFSETTNIADNGKNAIFQVNGIATERSSNTFSISGYSVTLKSTFNSVQTIAEKYTSAQNELQLAGINLTNKTNQLNAAKDAYYGIGASGTPSYSSAHNSAYLAAFGNTLSLSAQETFNKLGSSFWKNLSDEEIDFITANAGNLKDAIEDSDYPNLKVLSDDKIEALANLSQSELQGFKLQANYQTYGSKLKDFDADTITAIKNFEFNSEDDIATIRENIDNLEVSDNVKNILKSLSKEDLTNLLATDESTLAIYQQKAQADDLKSKFNSLGDSFLSNLSNDEIAAISSIDFNDENAISSISDEGLRTKLEKLSSNQLNALKGLTEEDLTNFKALAEQNNSRANYIKAVNERTDAQTRLTNAQNTFDTAELDAVNAGILNGDGSVNTAIVESAPTTSPVTLTSTTNVDDIVNKIKDFVNTYNGLIKELNDLLKESKYRDYAPLTEAQRKEMDEKEIALWEEKAKSGLLRNDSIIREALSSMRALVYESNPAVSDTRFNTLFSIGITTSKTYNDGGTLVIDEDKLRKALEENPDAVATLFTNTSGKKDDKVTVNGVEKNADTRGYLDKLREAMSNVKNKIEKKAGRSTMTENQYTLGKTLKDIAARISNWKTKLQTIENRYWKQFTAMEQAINKANMQSSYFFQQPTN